ncbi:MAG: hypothetical protein VX335_05645 [Pseudomonadota bacterium]|nr:hypothetical protein [Pseudomonadota bacterium]
MIVTSFTEELINKFCLVIRGHVNSGNESFVPVMSQLFNLIDSDIFARHGRGVIAEQINNFFTTPSKGGAFLTDLNCFFLRDDVRYFIAKLKKECSNTNDISSDLNDFTCFLDLVSNCVAQNYKNSSHKSGFVNIKLRLDANEQREFRLQANSDFSKFLKFIDTSESQCYLLICDHKSYVSIACIILSLVVFSCSIFFTHQIILFSLSVLMLFFGIAVHVYNIIFASQTKYFFESKGWGNCSDISSSSLSGNFNKGDITIESMYIDETSYSGMLAEER